MAFLKTGMLKLIVLLRPAARYLLIIWLLTIITISSLPNIPTLKIHTAKIEFRLDYFMHFCEYGFLTFLTLLSFAGREFKMKFAKVILITSCLIYFSILDEYHQKLIPGRTCSIRDFMSDATGIIIATIFILFVFRSLKIVIGKKI